MNNNTLIFNTEKYNKVMNNLKQSNKSILDYYTNQILHQNINTSNSDNFNFISHNNIAYNNNKDISIENEIRGINKINSKCVNEKHIPDFTKINQIYLSS